jgi:hypothetical protein
MMNSVADPPINNVWPDIGKVKIAVQKNAASMLE